MLKLFQDGKVRGVRAGKRWLISREALEAFLGGGGTEGEA